MRQVTIERAVRRADDRRRRALARFLRRALLIGGLLVAGWIVGAGLADDTAAAATGAGETRPAQAMVALDDAFAVKDAIDDRTLPKAIPVEDVDQALGEPSAKVHRALGEPSVKVAPRSLANLATEALPSPRLDAASELPLRQPVVRQARALGTTTTRLLDEADKQVAAAGRLVSAQPVGSPLAATVAPLLDHVDRAAPSLAEPMLPGLSPDTGSTGGGAPSVQEESLPPASGEAVPYGALPGMSGDLTGIGSDAGAKAGATGRSGCVCAIKHAPPSAPRLPYSAIDHNGTSADHHRAGQPAPIAARMADSETPMPRYAHTTVVPRSASPVVTAVAADPAVAPD